MNQTLELIKEFLTDYATYVNQTRANVALDGFKAVQRRIYYATWNIARDKFVKTATIVGNVLAYYHPHGDSSVADAIVGMVRNGYLIGKGNWGTKCTLEETKAAAIRYTEVKFNKALKWSMNYIKYAEYTKSDIDYDEPLLIPTPIPIGLIGDLVNYPQPQQGIGVGIRTVVPLYKTEDLKQLIKALFTNQEVPVVDPYFGSNVKVLESDSYQILKSGTGKATILPNFKYDDTSRELHIFALTKNLLTIIKPWKDKLDVIDLGKPDHTHVIIRPKKYQKINFEDVANEILVKMKHTVSFKIYVAIPNQDKHFIVYQIGVLPWLKAQFTYYLECRKNKLQQQKEKLVTILAEYDIIEQIRPYLANYLKQTDKPNPDEFIQQLPDSFDKAAVDQVLRKHSIRKLLSLELDRQPILEELKQVDHELDNLLDYALKDLEVVSKKEKRDPMMEEVAEDLFTFSGF